MDDADRKAREMREGELLALCLANPRMPGQIGEACDHAEEAIATALREAEKRGMMRAAEIAYQASLPFDGEIVAGNIRAAIERAAKED